MKIFYTSINHHNCHNFHNCITPPKIMKSIKIPPHLIDHIPRYPPESSSTPAIDFPPESSSTMLRNESRPRKPSGACNFYPPTRVSAQSTPRSAIKPADALPGGWSREKASSRCVPWHLRARRGNRRCTAKRRAPWDMCDFCSPASSLRAHNVPFIRGRVDKSRVPRCLPCVRSGSGIRIVQVPSSLRCLSIPRLHSSLSSCIRRTFRYFSGATGYRPLRN